MNRPIEYTERFFPKIKQGKTITLSLSELSRLMDGYLNEETKPKIVEIPDSEHESVTLFEDKVNLMGKNNMVLTGVSLKYRHKRFHGNPTHVNIELPPNSVFMTLFSRITMKHLPIFKPWKRPML